MKSKKEKKSSSSKRKKHTKSSEGKKKSRKESKKCRRDDVLGHDHSHNDDQAMNVLVDNKVSTSTSGLSIQTLRQRRLDRERSERRRETVIQAAADVYGTVAIDTIEQQSVRYNNQFQHQDRPHYR